ncbi:MAG: helix-turn-helix domain-containing protein [Candidatus Nanoarchaeia archaeon]|nr:helix-turn-helix domain-containing protein [Candidatus Nanoarchaeia archaeon]
MEEHILMDLGMTLNEAKVYIALLEIGSSSVVGISKKCKIHRPNIYDSLQKLMEKGIVSVISTDDTKIYQASNPAFLELFWKEKELKLKSILPCLNSRFDMAKRRSFANIFEGINAIPKILYGLLKHNDEILVYGVPKVAPEMAKYFIMNFHKIRIKQKVVMKHIYNFNAKERIKYLNSLPYTQAKYAPIEVESLVATHICGDEVALIIWAENPKVIQIVDKDVADSYRTYFNLLWRIAKVPK